MSREFLRCDDCDTLVHSDHAHRHEGHRIHGNVSPMARALDAITRLLRFQYESLGYGRLRCRSCGSLASEDYDEGRRDFKAEPCSPICPFEIAKQVTLEASIYEKLERP